ncbi:MAG: hypothetical protein KGI25_08350 [Thaumarchaeota archaeon]|nr:hypothetical protein [Nitrososphaerota archaeon]
MRFGSIKRKYIAIASASAAALVGGFLAYLSTNTQSDLIMPDNAELYNVTLSSGNFRSLKQKCRNFYGIPVTCNDSKCNKWVLQNCTVHP